MKKLKIVVGIIPIVLFAILAVCIKAGIGNNFESWVYTEFTENMSPTFTNIVKCITYIGDPITIITICLLTFIFSKTRLKYGLPMSISVISSFLINLGLKSMFARQRPDILRLVNETSYSFPSAHAMVNTAMYVVLILLVNKHIKSKKIKITLIGIFGILPVLIGFSRVYLGVHYILDVLGGFLLGFVVALIVYYLWMKIREKYISKYNLDENRI